MGVTPSAADRLLERKELILSRWEEAVRDSVAPSEKQDRLALRNSLPELLDGIAAALRQRDPRRVLREEERLATGHGRHRAENFSYSLEEVIGEYHVLRQVLFDVLEADGQQLSREDRDLIWDVLFVAIKRAASEFKSVRDQQTQRLSRELDHANADLKHALSEKSAEAVLKARLLDTIFERVEDYAIFSLDVTGHITSWAKGAQRIKQYTEQDVLGNHYSMLYPEEGRIRDEPMIHLDIARREGRFRGEGLRQRKNGELFLADVFITPMHDDERLVGFFKIVADLTERNRVIQERDLSRTQVETLELQSELRDRFIFTLSHDLRTPLSAARVGAQMIAKAECSREEHARVARRAIRNIDRVDRMITDLLDVSRIRAGHPMSLKIQQFDLVEEARAVSDDLASIHGDRFQIDSPPALIGAWDRDGIRRVLENLLSNALKYGDPVAPVGVQLKEVGDRVLITVHNRGSPIDARDQESLFDLFRRTASAASGTPQGWGLGLTLVRGITEAHGGVVTVRSLPHEGTSFILDLPKVSSTRPGEAADSPSSRN